MRGQLWKRRGGGQFMGLVVAAFCVGQRAQAQPLGELGVLVFPG